MDRKYFAAAAMTAMLFVLSACADTGAPTVSSSVPSQTDSSASVSQPAASAESDPSETPRREESSSEAAPLEPAAEVSGELFENRLAVGSTVFTLPFAAKELEELGFFLAPGEDEKTLGAGTFRIAGVVNNEDYDKADDFVVQFFNPSKSEVSWADSSVSLLSFDISREPLSFAIACPKGIVLGSSPAEVRAAYGEPTETSGEEEKVYSLTYENPDDDRNYWGFKFQKQKLVYVSVEVPMTTE